MGTVYNFSELMKSIVTLLAITLLAALALAGCSQNGSSNSTDMQTTNSSANYTNGVPDTNMPASTNQ